MIFSHIAKNSTDGYKPDETQDQQGTENAWDRTMLRYEILFTK